MIQPQDFSSSSNSVFRVISNAPWSLPSLFLYCISSHLPSLQRINDVAGHKESYFFVLLIISQSLLRCNRLFHNPNTNFTRHFISKNLLRKLVSANWQLLKIISRQQVYHFIVQFNSIFSKFLLHFYLAHSIPKFSKVSQFSMDRQSKWKL